MGDGCLCKDPGARVSTRAPLSPGRTGGKKPCEHGQWGGVWLCQGCYQESWREGQKVSRLQMEDCRDLGQRVKYLIRICDPPLGLPCRDAVVV